MLWLALAFFVGMSSLCGVCGHEYRRVVDDGIVVYVAVTGTGDAGLRRLYWVADGLESSLEATTRSHRQRIERVLRGVFM
jgi:hypothetical protein